MNSADFRKELLKIMPGYSWTVHKTGNPLRMTATGIQSSGFNRLSTLQVTRIEGDGWGLSYEVKSAPHGTKSEWAHTNRDRTLARALRGLQDYYQAMSNTYRGLAARLQEGRAEVRNNPAGEASAVQHG